MVVCGRGRRRPGLRHPHHVEVLRVAGRVRARRLDHVALQHRDVRRRDLARLVGLDGHEHGLPSPEPPGPPLVDDDVAVLLGDVVARRRIPAQHEPRAHEDGGDCDHEHRAAQAHPLVPRAPLAALLAAPAPAVPHRGPRQRLERGGAGGHRDDAGGVRRERRRLEHVGHDSGDVVHAAVGVGRGDQGACRIAGLADRQEAPHVLQGQLVAQTVAAQEQAVVRTRLHLDHVGLDVVVDAQRARQDVAPGVLRLLRVVDPPEADQLGGDRVVLGQLAQVAVAEQVAARVADVGEQQALGPACGDDGDRDERRAHAREARFPAPLEDPAVRVEDRRAQPPRRAVHPELGLDHLCGDGRGHLAAGVPAHAVRDEDEGLRRDERILVLGPHLPRVGAAGGLERGHRTTSRTKPPTCTTSPRLSLVLPSIRFSLT